MSTHFFVLIQPPTKKVGGPSLVQPQLRPPRVELGTYGLEVRCSMQVSCGREDFNNLCHLSSLGAILDSYALRTVLQFDTGYDTSLGFRCQKAPATIAPSQGVSQSPEGASAMAKSTHSSSSSQLSREKTKGGARLLGSHALPSF